MNQTLLPQQGQGTQKTQPTVSVVIPVRNAEDTLENCLKSLSELDYPKDKVEVIIADGLSTDRTREIAESYGAKIITNPGIRVVSGRNIGFEAAQGELIAFSDADCVMDKDWLKNSIKYFANETVAGLGGPNLIPQDAPAFSKAVSMLFDYAFSFGGGAPTRVYDKVIESRAHSSNAIYRASVLRRVMPIDEDMFEGEDVVMNQKIRRLGYKLLYVPDVVVHHYRRATPKKWWSQMYRYGLGKILMRRKMSGTITPTQFALGLTIPVIILISIALAILNSWFPLIFILGGASLVAISSASFAFLKTKSCRVALNMPLATLILPIAWSCGFLHESFIPTRQPERGSHKKEK